MWIIYQSKSLAIVGLTGHGPRELSRDKALRGVLAAQPGAVISQYGALLIEDDERVAEIVAAYPDRVSLEEGPDEPRILIREKREFHLAIEIDAPDVHPVDGIPEITADGKATALVTLQKVDAERKPVR